MTQPKPESSSDVPRFRSAFAKLLAEIREVPERQFEAINIDIASSVATVLGASSGIRRHREQIMRETPFFDITLVDNLELYALALGHAHTICQTANELPLSSHSDACGQVLGDSLDAANELPLSSCSLASPAARQARTDAPLREGLRWRAVMVNDTTTLISRGLLDPGALAELKGKQKWKQGRKRVAFDLFALANVYRKHWDAVAERTSMTPEELDDVENLADRLLTAAGWRRAATSSAAQALRDRRAAFTLFINAYDEVRCVIRFIRRKQRDADAIAPSLYAARAAGKKKSAALPDKHSTAAPPAEAPQQLSRALAVAPAPTSLEPREPGPFLHA